MALVMASISFAWHGCVYMLLLLLLFVDIFLYVFRRSDGEGIVVNWNQL